MKFKKNPDHILTAVSWVLFLTCSIAFIQLGYKCFQKYSLKPQSVEISTWPQYDLDLPYFTFCRTQDKRPGLNMTILQSCNLTIEDIQKGQFYKDECENEQNFWQNLYLGFDHLELKEVMVNFKDGTEQEILLDENSQFWSKRFLIMNSKSGGWNFHTCFTLNLPRVENMIISTLEITTMDKNIELEVFIHSFGKLNHLPKSSYDLTEMDLLALGSNVDVRYNQFRIVTDQNGSSCIDDKNYSESETLIGKMEEEVLNKFNCSTPLSLNVTQLCKNLTLEDYKEIGRSKILEIQKPCQFLGKIELAEKRDTDPGTHTFHLSSSMQKIESKFSYEFLDLFADFGGYLGIFLGTSLFQLRDAISYLIKKM